MTLIWSKPRSVTDPSCCWHVNSLWGCGLKPRIHSRFSKMHPMECSTAPGRRWHFPVRCCVRKGKQLWHQLAPGLATQTMAVLWQQTDPDTKVCFAQGEKNQAGQAREDGRGVLHKSVALCPSTPPDVSSIKLSIPSKPGSPQTAIPCLLFQQVLDEPFCFPFTRGPSRATCSWYEPVGTSSFGFLSLWVPLEMQHVSLLSHTLPVTLVFFILQLGVGSLSFWLKPFLQRNCFLLLNAHTSNTPPKASSFLWEWDLLQMMLLDENQTLSCYSLSA